MEAVSLFPGLSQGASLKRVALLERVKPMTSFLLSRLPEGTREEGFLLEAPDLHLHVQAMHVLTGQCKFGSSARKCSETVKRRAATHRHRLKSRALLGLLLTKKYVHSSTNLSGWMAHVSVFGTIRGHIRHISPLRKPHSPRGNTPR